MVNTRTWLELRLNNDYRVTGQLQLCPRGNTGDQVQVQRLFFYCVQTLEVMVQLVLNKVHACTVQIRKASVLTVASTENTCDYRHVFLQNRRTSLNQYKKKKTDNVPLSLCQIRKDNNMFAMKKNLEKDLERETRLTDM